MGKNIKKDWFKFEGLLGMPKPIHWQGWVCYGIYLSFIFLLARFTINSNENSITIFVIVFGISVIIFQRIAVLKSNYREIIKAYKTTRL